jgi:hypothetical protein
MEIRFDHLVIAARTLPEGVAWVESLLGVPMGPGGRHDLMGTHNRLLSLGPGRFLEVIAIDPGAPSPGRPRWFDLDASYMRERLAVGPALVTWVARTDAIEGALSALAIGEPEVLALSRGAYRWRIGVAASGALALGGVAPTLIEWEGDHPAAALADTGCRLETLELAHPEAGAILAALRAHGLAAGEPVVARAQGAGLFARLRTQCGTCDLRS